MTSAKPLRRLAAADAGFPPDTPEEDMKMIYKDWAKSYDKDHDDNGYVAVSITTKRLLQILSARNAEKDISIMDLGAGTGKVAEVLKSSGFNNIDAVDICQEMLDIAKEKGLYQRLICQSLGGNPLPIDDGTYDVVISIGVFTVGHVKATGFDEAARITKSGGLVLFTVRTDAYENEELGYCQKIDELAKSKVWNILEHHEIDYLLKYTKKAFTTAHFFVCQKV